MMLSDFVFLLQQILEPNDRVVIPDLYTVWMICSLITLNCWEYPIGHLKVISFYYFLESCMIFGNVALQWNWCIVNRYVCSNFRFHCVCLKCFTSWCFMQARVNELTMTATGYGPLDIWFSWPVPEFQE